MIVGLAPDPRSPRIDGGSIARRTTRLLRKTPRNLLIRPDSEGLQCSGRRGATDAWAYAEGVSSAESPTSAIRERVGVRHTGPVWQVAWAHPKFGDILASCSYDGKVIIWKEQLGQGPGAGGWTKIKEHTLHKASGAPHAL